MSRYSRVQLSPGDCSKSVDSHRAEDHTRDLCKLGRRPATAGPATAPSAPSLLLFAASFRRGR